MKNAHPRRSSLAMNTGKTGCHPLSANTYRSPHAHPSQGKLERIHFFHSSKRLISLSYRGEATRDWGLNEVDFTMFKVFLFSLGSTLLICGLLAGVSYPKTAACPGLDCIQNP